MPACPPPDRLEQLLADTLPVSDRAAVEDHVGRCPACQLARAQVHRRAPGLSLPLLLAALLALLLLTLAVQLTH